MNVNSADRNGWFSANSFLCFLYGLVRVWTAWHSICILWTHNCIVNHACSRKIFSSPYFKNTYGTNVDGRTDVRTNSCGSCCGLQTLTSENLQTRRVNSSHHAALDYGTVAFIWAASSKNVHFAISKGPNQSVYQCSIFVSLSFVSDCRFLSAHIC